MIRVRHHVAPSQFGMGLFIQQPLKRGLLVIDSDDSFTQTIRLDDYPVAVRDRLIEYVYSGQGKYKLPDGLFYYNTDDSRFMNHSDTPSCLYSPVQEIYIAAKNLEIGDELTCNYADFCERGCACFNF